MAHRQTVAARFAGRDESGLGAAGIRARERGECGVMSTSSAGRTRGRSRSDHGGSEAFAGGTLIVVLGDQLDEQSAALRGMDARHDTILMMEVREEAEHVPSHPQRTTLFLSAMRHFAAAQRESGRRLRYVELNDAENTHSFTGEVQRAARELRPTRIRIVQPGEHRVRAMVRTWESRVGIPVEVTPDEHFLTSTAEFARFARGRKTLVMEYFYREQRRRLNILMAGDNPEGGRWNLDQENRESFGREGPHAPPPMRFAPDAITRRVMEDVGGAFPHAYGTLEGFSWPVTRAHALEALEDFVTQRLRHFGPWEDAMWTGEPWLFHSLLAPALNLKLISPRECVEAALAEHARKPVLLNSLEGFIRQIIGWREFIRGVYDLEGEAYGERNGLEQHGRLPEFYWTGKTDMRCMRECVGSVLKYAYTHHIPRLMVLGNLALTAGVHPRAMTDWFLAMFADAVDWVTTPNTLGMSQHGDGVPGIKGPVVGTKPYVASGQYIARMSNFCRHCRYDPAQRTGENACPFTTFYWDFLIRQRERLAGNQRMAVAFKNVNRLTPEQRVEITVSAAQRRAEFGIGPIGPGVSR